ncbi:MAG: hypothetical protein ACRC1K_12115, partial [Planctomycetia bacterium]
MDSCKLARSIGRVRLSAYAATVCACGLVGSAVGPISAAEPNVEPGMALPDAFVVPPRPSSAKPASPFRTASVPGRL